MSNWLMQINPHNTKKAANMVLSINTYHTAFFLCNPDGLLIFLLVKRITEKYIIM